MNLSERAVIVKEVPRKCDNGNSSQFLRDFAHAISNVLRPAVVLDCSRACKIDKHAIHLFLCCLEEAMKRNGDVRLAGLHQDAWRVLESAGTGRLFLSFSTIAEAVDSYRRPLHGSFAVSAESAINEPTANAA